MSRIIPLSTAAFVVFCFFCLVSCETITQRAIAWEGQLGPIPETPLNPSDLLRELNLKSYLIYPGTAGRRNPLAMKPTYITIHSTQNPTGDVYAHAQALRKGALRGGRRSGYLFWHFTVQEDVAVQHLPTNEAGEHADFDGPGNRKSIGIEMAEHRGNDLGKTIERTAKLAALLMDSHSIPIQKVVPHFHWPREGVTPLHKNCPHFLLDRGKPRGTWTWFLHRVNQHHQRLARYRALSPEEKEALSQMTAGRSADEKKDGKA